MQLCSEMDSVMRNALRRAQTYAYCRYHTVKARSDHQYVLCVSPLRSLSVSAADPSTRKFFFQSMFKAVVTCEIKIVAKIIAFYLTGNHV